MVSGLVSQGSRSARGSMRRDSATVTGTSTTTTHPPTGRPADDSVMMASRPHESLSLEVTADYRERVLKFFRETYDLYKSLFAIVTPEGHYQRPDPLRHVLIFYIGHTACFFANKLTLAVGPERRVNGEFESLFAIGVDEMSWDDLLPDDYDWPALQAVHEYRAQVRAMVEDVIRTAPLPPVGAKVPWESPFWAIHMGVEHERIHLETSAVLIRQLPLEFVRVPDGSPWARIAPPAAAAGAVENELLPAIREPTRVQLARDRDSAYYGWDLEYGDSEVLVQPFRASRTLVSNAEFLKFMEDGGYERRELWTDEGWRWRGFDTRHMPRFWRRGGDGELRLRTMVAEIPLPLEWPVEVNHLEAKAFANWKGGDVRLPTEAEWRALRDQELGEGDFPAKPEQHNTLLAQPYASTSPVSLLPASPGGFYDIVGNVWQHTETPVDAFKGFAVHPWYDDFSVPTFDTKHALMCGGSWISTGNEATRHARYAFRRHFYQFAGIRYIESKDADATKIRTDVYERDDAVHQYVAFHYSPVKLFGVENFPKAVAEHCVRLADKFGTQKRRALDLGCAVGRTSLELAAAFQDVTGIDFSARFARVAYEARDKGFVTWQARIEGDIFKEEKADVDVDEAKRARVKFFQGDACNLDPRFTGYDLVVACNLIDRLYDPRRFLELIRDRVEPGGMLVICSPYTWLEEFTPREKWLTDGGSTFAALKKELGGAGWEFLEDTDVEMVIPETARKFQHTLSHLTAWRRRRE